MKIKTFFFETLLPNAFSIYCSSCGSIRGCLFGVSAKYATKNGEKKQNKIGELTKITGY